MTLSDPVTYLDNAATSFPKPPAVLQAVDEALRAGGNPGRGGHRMALAAGRRVLGARDAVARLLGAPDSARVLFTASATDSLNLAVKGLLHPGDHVVTTAAEHNALRRPLAALERLGVSVTRLPVSSEGFVDPAAVREALRPQTRLIALAHASNVSGAVQPIADIAEVARRAGALLLLDAAQTAGSQVIDLARMGVHLLAAPGHKGLLGPQGTGILCVDPAVELHPIREGGTGYMSTEAIQPAIFPEGFESGTVNVPGIAGLAAGVSVLLAEGVESVHRREQALTTMLAEGLRRIPGVTVHGPRDDRRRASVVSFTVASMDPSDLEEQLDERFGVIGRAGLHCGPGAHEALGTLALGGAMRLSPGYSTTESSIAAALQAVAALASGK